MNRDKQKSRLCLTKTVTEVHSRCFCKAKTRQQLQMLNARFQMHRNANAKSRMPKPKHACTPGTSPVHEVSEGTGVFTESTKLYNGHSAHKQLRRGTAPIGRPMGRPPLHIANFASYGWHSMTSLQQRGSGPMPTYIPCVERELRTRDSTGTKPRCGDEISSYTESLHKMMTGSTTYEARPPDRQGRLVMQNVQEINAKNEKP